MQTSEDRAFFRRALETSIRIGVVLLIAVWCFQVVRPFLQPLVWGAILAVAVHPAYARLRDLLGGRGALAAAALATGAILLLVVPAAIFTTSLVESASDLASRLREGELAVPPPPAGVADWPVVGTPVHDFWATASQNLEAALAQARPVLKAVGGRLLSTTAAAGFGVVGFIVSIAIAGALLSYSAQIEPVLRRVATRLDPDRGDQLVDLTRSTVESVTVGILGVAVIQGVLAGIGLLAAGVPAAGLWALLVLLMAVVQLPALLVLGPIAAYVFATNTTVVAVLFTVWSVAVALSDNVLKPILLGRGVEVPTLVIFLGAIGGFILEGIIGLFAGAVVLAVGFTLFKAWLEDATD